MDKTGKKKKRSGKGRRFAHLDKEARLGMLAYLENGCSQSEIAERMHVDQSTVSREIKRGSRTVQAKDPSAPCKAEGRRGGVCNRCPHAPSCKHAKTYYEPARSDEKARKTLSESRSKPRKLDPGTMALIDDIVRQGVERGQSLYHIHVTDPWLKSAVSLSHLQKLVVSGRMSVKRANLRHARRIRPGRRGRKEGARISALKAGRMYKDVLEFVARHPDALVIQCDSFLGTKTEETRILTLTFPDISFQKAYVYGKSDSADSVCALSREFARTMHALAKGRTLVLLCDNGPEFDRLPLIEEGEWLKVFYTRSYRPDDKAEAERNHGLMRYIFPKGRPLGNLKQKRLDEAMSNVNSYARDKLDAKTPGRDFAERYGPGAMEALGMREIAPAEVDLRMYTED